MLCFVLCSVWVNSLIVVECRDVDISWFVAWLHILLLLLLIVTVVDCDILLAIINFLTVHDGDLLLVVVGGLVVSDHNSTPCLVNLVLLVHVWVTA